MKSWKKSFTLAIVMFFICVSSAWAGNVGDVNINNLLVRKIVEEQVRQRVSRIEGSLWNSKNNYYTSANVNADGWADLTINDPVPGAYTSYISGQEYNEILGQNITRLESRSEIVIGKGSNIFTPELILSEWQEVVIKLPAKYIGSEEYFSATFMVGGQKYENYFYPVSSDRQYIRGAISIKATSDVSIIFDGRKYAIPLAYFFGAIGGNNQLALESLSSEVLTTLTIKASVMENYIVVPTEASTIKAAMQYAQAGMTVLLKDGHYQENFTLKPGVRLYGNPSCPECVVIESDQVCTIKAVEAGRYEIIGVTIKNNYTGDKLWNTGVVLFEMGADVRMRHSVIESIGVGDGLVTNYAPLQLANITFKGNRHNTALQRYNNNFNESLENLLFYNWNQSAMQSNGLAMVKNSLFWKAPMVVGDGSNVSGDPMFMSQYSSGVMPNIISPAIKQIMSQSGNYPGAMRPQLP